MSLNFNGLQQQKDFFVTLYFPCDLTVTLLPVFFICGSKTLGATPIWAPSLISWSMKRVMAETYCGAQGSEMIHVPLYISLSKAEFLQFTITNIWDQIILCLLGEGRGGRVALSCALFFFLSCALLFTNVFNLFTH